SIAKTWLRVRVPSRTSVRVAQSVERETPAWNVLSRLRGCSAVGSASPCQGEGRGFETRHPLWERSWSHQPERRTARSGWFLLVSGRCRIGTAHKRSWPNG